MNSHTCIQECSNLTVAQVERWKVTLPFLSGYPQSINTDVAVAFLLGINPGNINPQYQGTQTNPPDMYLVLHFHVCLFLQSHHPQGRVLTNHSSHLERRPTRPIMASRLELQHVRECFAVPPNRAKRSCTLATKSLTARFKTSTANLPTVLQNRTNPTP